MAKSRNSKPFVRSTRRPTQLLAASMLFMAIASCGNPPSKSGGDVGTATIHATSTGDPNSSAGDLMKRISSQVGSLSNGSIEVVTGELLDSESETDQDGAMVEFVRSGDADVAVVRAGALSSAGAPRFAALQAPFLIDNQEAAEMVANDQIADDMLASLDDLGLVGLAVIPGGLRHPFGWYSPLVGIADYTNKRINTRPGRELDMLFDALGATTDHSVGQERATAATKGELNGVEVSLQMKFSTGPPLIMTANVVLYTKFDVVVVNKRFLDGLSDAQQAVLRGAVSSAIREELDDRAPETAAFQQWCGEIGNVAVKAKPSDIDELRQAVAPMIAEMERDPFTKIAIERIRQLAAGTKPADLGTCSGPAPASVAIDAVGDQSVIDGTWRFEVTEQNLLDAGVPATDATKDVGVHTFVFENGMLSGETPTIPCYGTYAINGSQFSWAFNPDSCGGIFRGTFSRNGDTMTFTIDQSNPDGPFFAGFFKDGLTRIADAP